MEHQYGGQLLQSHSPTDLDLKTERDAMLKILKTFKKNNGPQGFFGSVASRKVVKLLETACRDHESFGFE